MAGKALSTCPVERMSSLLLCSRRGSGSMSDEEAAQYVVCLLRIGVVVARETILNSWTLVSLRAARD